MLELGPQKEEEAGSSERVKGRMGWGWALPSRMYFSFFSFVYLLFFLQMRVAVGDTPPGLRELVRGRKRLN